VSPVAPVDILMTAIQTAGLELDYSKLVSVFNDADTLVNSSTSDADKASLNAARAIIDKKEGMNADINTFIKFHFPSGAYPDLVQVGGDIALKTGAIDTAIENYPDANIATASSTSTHGGVTPVKPVVYPTRAQNNLGIPINQVSQAKAATVVWNNTFGGAAIGCAMSASLLFIMTSDGDISYQNIVASTGSNLAHKYNGESQPLSAPWSLVATADNTSGYAYFLRRDGLGKYHYIQASSGGLQHNAIYSELSSLGTIYDVFFYESSYFFSLSGGKLYRSTSANGQNPSEVILPNGTAGTTLYFDGHRLYTNGKYYRPITMDTWVKDEYAVGMVGVGPKRGFTGSHWVSVIGSTTISVTTYGHDNPSYLTRGLSFDRDKDTSFSEIPHEGNAHNADEIDMSFSSTNIKGLESDGAYIWALTDGAIYRFTDAGSDGITYRDDQYIAPEISSGTAGGVIGKVSFTYPASFTPTVTHQPKLDISAQVPLAQDLTTDGTNIWVLTAGTSLVRKFKDITTMGIPDGPAIDLSGFDNDMRGIARIDSNQFWCVGAQNKKLYVFDGNFTHISTQTLPSVITNPTSMTLSPNNHLWISCADTNQVHEITQGLNYTGVVQTVANSRGVMVKDGDMWVADNQRAYRYVLGNQYIGSLTKKMDGDVPLYVVVKKG